MVKQILFFSLSFFFFNIQCMNICLNNKHFQKDEISDEDARVIIRDLQKIDGDHFDALLYELLNSYDKVNIRSLYELHRVANSVSVSEEDQIEQIQYLTPKVMRKFGFKRNNKTE